MADIVSRETRSQMMRGIRGANTKPEILIRRLLHAKGYRFRIHVKSLPGKPDIVLKKFNAVLLVHGCFWHGHDCQLFKLPETRTEFWSNKIARNRANDAKVIDALRIGGWRVGVVWECALKGKARIEPERLARRIFSWLQSDSPSFVLMGKKQPCS